MVVSLPIQQLLMDPISLYSGNSLLSPWVVLQYHMQPYSNWSILTTVRLTRLDFLKLDQSRTCPLQLFFSCHSFLIHIHTQLASDQCLSYSNCKHSLPLSDPNIDLAVLANWMGPLLSLQFWMQLPHSEVDLLEKCFYFYGIVCIAVLPYPSLPKLLRLIILYSRVMNILREQTYVCILLSKFQVFYIQWFFLCFPPEVISPSSVSHRNLYPSLWLFTIIWEVSAIC